MADVSGTLDTSVSCDAQQLYEQVRAQVHGSYVAHGADENAKAATGTTAFESKRKRQPFHVTRSESLM